MIGNHVAPTPSSGDNSDRIATTAFVAGGFVPIPAAWATFTPFIAATSGTLITASATGRFIQIGKLVFFSIVGTITTNGTGAVGIAVGLPVAAQNVVTAIGRETALTNKAVIGTANSAGATSLLLLFYDAGYPGSSGANIIINGSYEAQ